MIYFCGFLPDYHKKTRVSGLFSFARGAVLFRKAQILLRVRRDARPLFRRERAHDTVRVAEHEQSPPGISLAPRDKRPRADHAVLPDPRAVEDDAPMPISVLFPTSAPCTTALCPTVTLSPSTAGAPYPTCTVALSCTLVFLPMTTGAMSPRIQAPHQILAPSPRVTSPPHTRLMDKYLFPLFYAFHASPFLRLRSARICMPSSMRFLIISQVIS